MPSSQKIIAQTQKWVTDVVVGCHFCPFAAAVIKQQKVHYVVEQHTSMKTSIQALLRELTRLDTDSTIETSFLIFPHAFEHFNDFLALAASADKLLKRQGYIGIYQIASFHPLYQFADAEENDAANYTNRSIYPMLHLLREASVAEAVAQYKNSEDIPAINIQFAREKGLSAMQKLREDCI